MKTYYQSYPYGIYGGKYVKRPSKFTESFHKLSGNGEDYGPGYQHGYAVPEYLEPSEQSYVMPQKTVNIPRQAHPSKTYLEPYEYAGPSQYVGDLQKKQQVILGAVDVVSRDTPKVTIPAGSDVPVNGQKAARITIWRWVDEMKEWVQSSALPSRDAPDRAQYKITTTTTPPPAPTTRTVDVIEREAPIIAGRLTPPSRAIMPETEGVAPDIMGYRDFESAIPELGPAGLPEELVTLPPQEIKLAKPVSKLIPSLLGLLAIGGLAYYFFVKSKKGA